MLSHHSEFLFTAIVISGGILLVWFGYLGIRRSRQRQAIRQFRDSLVIVANTLSEGRDFENAVAVLADLGPKPLSGEFRRLQALKNRGLEQAGLIAEFQRRVPCFEADYLASALASYPDEPEKVASSLTRLNRIRSNRAAEKKAARSALASTRRWIRGLLLFGPIALTAIAMREPAWFGDVRSRMVSRSSVFSMIGGLLVLAIWFVLILQKQDESEIVFD